jgi:hypothetical protein
MRKVLLALLIASFVISLSSVGKAIKDESLVLYLSFDEGKGEISKDLTGHGNDATLKKDARWTDGKYGKAVLLDGEDDYVVCEHDESLNIIDAVTVEAWVNPQELPPTEYSPLITKDKPNAWPGYRLLAGGSRKAKQVTACICSADVDHDFELFGKTTISNKEWHHLAMTYDKKELKVYLNGVIDGSTSEYTFPLTPTTTPLYIGTFNGGNDPGKNLGIEYSNVIIDEVAIYSSALTEKEIKQDMKGRITAVAPYGKLAVTWARIKSY